MRNSAIQFYALAVCFSALMCLVVALGVGIYDIIQISAPEFTMQQWQSDYYKSNERFLASNPDKKELPQAEVSELREGGYRDALAAERHSAKQSAVFITIILAIDVVVFAVHWRLATRNQSQLPGHSPDAS